MSCVKCAISNTIETSNAFETLDGTFVKVLCHSHESVCVYVAAVNNDDDGC